MAATQSGGGGGGGLGKNVIGNFYKFDPTTIKTDRIMVAIGMKGSGKTTVIEDICSHIKDRFDHTFGCSPTYESRNWMRTVMPGCNVHSKTDVIKPAIQQLLAAQHKRTEMKNFKKHDPKNPNQNPKKRLRSIFIMMDDCAFDKSLTKGDTMNELVTNNRWHNIGVIQAVQYCIFLPPAFRTCADYIIAMREPDADNRKKLYKYFFGIFGDFKKFERVFAEMTDDYGCMVMDKTIPTTKAEQCIFHYRASQNHPSFEMGSDVIWALWRKHRLPKNQRTDSHLLGCLEGD